jgi:threonine-phosphate decarboxylase
VKDTHGGDIWSASRRTGVLPHKIIDFSANINPLGLSPMAREAVKEALGLIGAYPDPEARLLKEALAAYHGLSKNRILTANGSTELIYLIPRVFAPERALVVEPSFSEYRASLVSSGCRVESFLTVEDESFTLNGERLALRLKKGYDLLYIANPSSPTGALIEKSLLVWLAGECRKYGTVLMVDEAFADFTDQESIKKEAPELRGVIVLRSMTKFFSMAGLRLGYLVAEKDLIKRFTRVIPPWSVNTLAIAAGASTLRDTSYMERTLNWFEDEKAFMFRELGKFRSLKVFPSSANFFLVKLLTEAITGSYLKDILIGRGILIRELSAVRGLGDRFFRVALLTRKHNELLLDALSSVLSNVKNSVNHLDRRYIS